MSPQKRKAAVEEAIRTRGWSEIIVAGLMKTTGASRRTLYRDRDEIGRVLAQEETESLPERRALFLADLRRVRNQSAGAGAYSPAARLLGMEATILGLDESPLPEPEAEEGELDTSLEGVLREVRKLRKQAQAGHKHTAAEKLLAREAELVESIRQRDEAEHARQMQHLPLDAIVDLVIENFHKLPATLRARLRESLDGAS